MAAYNKFDQFVEDLHKGVHDFSTHTFKVLLTNTAPTSADEVKADLTEIAPGNGYAAGGAAVTIASVAQAAGTLKVVANDVVFTAAGGPIGPFQYFVLYNDSATSPADALVAWWDRGAAITLADGDSTTWDADPTTGIFTDA